MRNKPEARPLFPTKHEYDASLRAYIEAVTVLHNTVRTVIQLATTDNFHRLLPKLKEAEEHLQRVTYGAD